MWRLFSLIALSLTTVTSTVAVAKQTDAPQVQSKSAIQVETVAKGLRNPWGLQFLPDGRLLVTERPGTMRLVSRDGTISDPISGVPDVSASGQGGLLDVLLAKDFASSGMIYFSYAEPRDGVKNGTTVARAKLNLTNAGGSLENLEVIFRQTPAIASNLHFGSRLVWAKDGTLFVTTGDRGIVRKQAQNPRGYLGKVVRINADGSTPADNPKIDKWQPNVWSIGHRNIQGAALHPDTGELWTVEHGARGGDELNRPQKGKNYGWPVITYGRDYTFLPIGEGTKKEGLEQPVYYWDPSIATSGLTFYSGDLFPKWRGNAFVGGLKGQHIARLILKDGEVVGEEKLLTGRNDRIRDVRQGPDGALWALTDDRQGLLLRITPKP
jgi:aldose sugar dehydrogenase